MIRRGMPMVWRWLGAIHTRASADGVAVAGGYAYVADDGGGLRVISVSTPSAPVEVGYYDTPGYAYGVAVAGGHSHAGVGRWCGGGWGLCLCGGRRGGVAGDQCEHSVGAGGGWVL